MSQKILREQIAAIRTQETVLSGELAVTLHWSRQGDSAPRLASLTLDWAAGTDATEEEHLSRTALALREAIHRYLRGESPEWPELPFDFGELPPFRAKVLRTLMERVPSGAVVTYAGLASMAGSPRAARAVGSAMSNNPWPLVIPCHRVLASKGLGGFSGAGLPMKRFLLEQEGIDLKEIPG